MAARRLTQAEQVAAIRAEGKWLQILRRLTPRNRARLRAKIDQVLASQKAGAK